MPTCIALLRGINVGKAKRIAMGQLRRIVAGLGHTRVRTLLNSGNVVFDVAAAEPDLPALAAAIRAGITAECRFDAEVVVLGAERLDAIVAANPLPEGTAEPAQFLVAFVAEPAVLARCRLLESQDWTPDRFALGAEAAYLWCTAGILQSRLGPLLLKQAGITTRNWATVLKLQALARNRDAAG